MFKQVLAVVLSVLGISALEKKDGKSTLTEEQRTTLTGKYGDKFVEQFLKDLAAFEENGQEVSGKEIEDIQAQLNEKQKDYDRMKADFEKYKRESATREENLNALINKLSEDPETDLKTEKTETAQMKPTFKLDMNMLHNKVLDNAVNGDGLMALAGNTIETEDLKTEFGKYVSDRRYEIITLLFGKLQCTQYMTTKMTDKTEWQAVQSVISDLIQKFTPYWTPSGKVKFTPIVIKNRKHKINYPLKPAEIMEDVIAYLYDEGLQPKDMPIVKYCIEVLLKPKVEEERDEQLAVGVFDESKNKNKNDGDDGDLHGSLDGYITILKQLHEDKEQNIIRLLPGVNLTRQNIYDQFDNIYQQIPKKYRTKKLPIFIDPDLLNLYELARDDKFPNSKNEDENKKRLQHTNFTFVPLDGMTGTGLFFITPKENFIHLLSKNKGLSKIWIQAENYDVKIFAEWWEAVGFAIAELIFAYVPPKETPDGSGSKQSL